MPRTASRTSSSSPTPSARSPMRSMWAGPPTCRVDSIAFVLFRRVGLQFSSRYKRCEGITLRPHPGSGNLDGVDTRFLPGSREICSGRGFGGTGEKPCFAGLKNASIILERSCSRRHGCLMRVYRDHSGHVGLAVLVALFISLLVHSQQLPPKACFVGTTNLTSEMLQMNFGT